MSFVCALRFPAPFSKKNLLNSDNRKKAKIVKMSQRARKRSQTGLKVSQTDLIVSQKDSKIGLTDDLRF